MQGVPSTAQQPVVVAPPWWVLLNRAWVMTAAAHLLWSLLPQVFLLFPDRHSGSGGLGRGGGMDNVTGGVPFSSLTHRPFSEEQRLLMKEEARRMFYWGYDHYMQHAFPQDELNPIRCRGRGHDWEDLTNTNVNDALGDYSLTLVDSLDTLVIMGNDSEFRRAAQLVVDHVLFDSCTTVQVFEATIRVMGSLLSAYLLTQSPPHTSPPHTSPLYLSTLFPPDDSTPERLLELAHDLAIRLLPAFENTATGIPHPRVNLCSGVPADGTTETCTAGAGTLSVEFMLLSRLIGDPTYENLARRAIRALWDRRHPGTGLVGNVINIHSGQWTGRMSGLGAGIDSFYEYLLKSYILFGEKEDLEMFSQMYASVMKYLKKGRSCRDVFQDNSLPNTPYFVNVDYSTGRTLNYWMDALSASFAGVQVLAGDLEEAICTHAVYYSIWRRYGALPERFDWNTKTPNVKFYPLRPELVESTYLLYQATQNPFYLHVGSDILNSLEKYTKTSCGYATLHDITTKTKEDRMESFFLSETCKYLYLLFDTDNVVNRYSSQFIFTTEGHVIQLDPALRRRPWDRDSFQDTHRCLEDTKRAVARVNESFVSHSCPVYEHSKRYALPLSRERLGEIEALVGLYTSKPSGG